MLFAVSAASPLAAHAAPCSVQQTGFGFQDCAQISNKMVVSVPEIVVGSTTYTVAAQPTFDDYGNPHLPSGDKLCANYGGKKMVGFTYDDAGDEQSWVDLAFISAKDGTFQSIGSNEYKMDTLTCSF
jgi:hypothetical protein